MAHPALGHLPVARPGDYPGSAPVPQEEPGKSLYGLGSLILVGPLALCISEKPL